MHLTTWEVNGSGSDVRSGTRALGLLTAPLNVLVLRALADGPKRQIDLRRAADSPAQTTLRAHLRELADAGLIARDRQRHFPRVLEHQLTPPGRELLFVADVLERWLAGAPEGPLQFGSETAKVAIKALSEGWSTTMLRALAAGPLSLTELDRVIAGLTYPALERRLAAMRLVGQIEARPQNGRGTPYAVTDWLRRGVAPLATAARWELRNHAAAAVPLTRVDIEAAFLLTMPLLRLPGGLSGSCRLTVEAPNGGGPRMVGTMVEASQGKVVSCTTRLEGNPDAWTSAPVPAWLAALIEADAAQLELGGDGRLARAFVEGMHRALFGTAKPESQTQRAAQCS